MAITKLLEGMPSRLMQQEPFDAAMAQLMVDLPAWGAEANALADGLAAIAAGGAFTLGYTFSTTTTDADPGLGVLRLNNLTQDAATTLYADVNSGGSDVTALLDAMGDSSSSIKGQLRLVNRNDASKWIVFNVTGVTSATGYRKLSVQRVASSASSPFGASASLILYFQRTGDVGTTGTLARRTTALASSATPAVNIDNFDTLVVTALAVNVSQLPAPTGTPQDGRTLVYRIKDNGTARLLAYNAIFRASPDLVLPSTTFVGKTLYLGFMYNQADAKWDLIALLNNI